VIASSARVRFSPKLEATCSLGESQRHGALDLRAQRDAGRVLRPPRNGRQRRDAPLLDARDGRGGSDALRAPDLRADGGRLAPRAQDPKATPSNRNWAKKLEAKPKYVVSTTRRDFPWSNTHHVEGDLTRAVKALKKATPRGLLVGSPKLSAALQRLDLVDEYRFVVHPVVAGHGPFLFSGLQPSLRLKFVAATRLKSGIVALHYRRR
jgi:dihydrofolate reductase